VFMLCNLPVVVLCSIRIYMLKLKVYKSLHMHMHAFSHTCEYRSW
jgi:hypothetical protein